METLLSIAKAAGATFVVLSIWYVYLTLVRRKSGCQRDTDVLEYMTHGCAGCKGDGACRRKETQEEHHELT